MPDLTPAQELREAARLMRERARAATPGPWRTHDTHLLSQGGHTATVLSGEGNATDLRAWLPTMSQHPWDERRNAWNDSEYIASMHPGVALAVADLLDKIAWMGELDPEMLGRVGCDEAIAIARAYLKAGEPE